MNLADTSLFNEAGRELLRLKLFRTYGDFTLNASWFTAASKKEFNVIRPHTHSGTEFHYVLEGSFTSLYEGKIETMNRGDLRIISPGVVHGSIREGSKNLTVLVIMAEFQAIKATNYTQVMQRMFLEPRGGADSIPDCGVETLLLMAMEEALQKGYAFLENINSLLLLLLNRFAEALRIAPLQERNETYTKYTRSDNKDEPADRMDIVDAYIHANLYGAISVRDVAERVNLSERQLLRLIKSQRGVSTAHYILKKKLSKARQMLEETDCSIREIALRLGFCDEYHFSSSFKKEEGLSPVRYRNSVR